jgi:hypothetical protein
MVNVIPEVVEDYFAAKLPITEEEEENSSPS